MRVTMKTCLVGDGLVVLAGEEHECDELEASRLVHNDLATGPKGWTPRPLDECYPAPPSGEEEVEEAASTDAAQRETATSKKAARRGKRGG